MRRSTDPACRMPGRQPARHKLAISLQLPRVGLRRKDGLRSKQGIVATATRVACISDVARNASGRNEAAASRAASTWGSNVSTPHPNSLLKGVRRTCQAVCARR